MNTSQTKVLESYQQSVVTPILCLILLWLAGVGLRITILAQPPVIPLMQADLNMNETEIGFLSSIPTAFFAMAAILGALLIARLGAFTTVIIGLFGTALGSALRGAVPDVTLLYLTTLLTGLGVAIMQPAMPALVSTWLPRNVRLATAVYINGLLLGAVLPVMLTSPVVLPLVGSWRFAFVFWGGICAIIACLVFILAPRMNAETEVPAQIKVKWWPNWRNKLIWQLGIMMGCMNALYFTANFFIPGYLETTGHAGDINAALIALNAGQLPASILLLFAGNGLEQQVKSYVICGLLSIIAILGILFGNSLMIICGAGLLGFVAAFVLILVLALPALLSRSEDVHRTAAAIITIAYTCAVIVPILSGIMWDKTGLPKAAFIPILFCSFMLIFVSLTARIKAD